MAPARLPEKRTSAPGTGREGKTGGGNDEVSGDQVKSDVRHVDRGIDKFDQNREEPCVKVGPKSSKQARSGGSDKAREVVHDHDARMDFYCTECYNPFANAQQLFNHTKQAHKHSSDRVQICYLDRSEDESE